MVLEVANRKRPIKPMMFTCKRPPVRSHRCTLIDARLRFKFVDVIGANGMSLPIS